jgi:hypothetical protein
MIAINAIAWLVTYGIKHKIGTEIDDYKLIVSAVILIGLSLLSMIVALLLLLII